MFVKILPYYQLCTSGCVGLLRSTSCENVHQEKRFENNNQLEKDGFKVLVDSNGATNHDRTHSNEAFQKDINRDSFPEFVRICCWCFMKQRDTSPSSPSVTNGSAVRRTRRSNDCYDGEDDSVTNVVPLDGGTIYTPTKNFIGRDGDVGDDDTVDSCCHNMTLAVPNEDEDGCDHQLSQQPSERENSSQGQSPRSSAEGDDERWTQCSTASTTVLDCELADGVEENSNKQQVSTHAQKLDLDQRPNLSPSKNYGNVGHYQNNSNNINNNNNGNGNGRFFTAADTVETPCRPRFLGEATGGGINQESYIIHRDEQYDSENDEKSSNDSTSTRIISNSTFNFGGQGSDHYPPSHPPSILSSRPQSVTSRKSAGSGILKNDGRLSRTSNISYSNPSLKQTGDSVSVRSNRSAKSRQNEPWYEREGTPARSEDVISSNQVQYESDYDDDVEEELVAEPKRTPKQRFPTPSPHPLQTSYSTEELSNTNYNHVEESELSPPKSRIQSASLSNLQQLEDVEIPEQQMPAKKILKKPYLARKTSKVTPVKEVVSGIKAKNKMNEMLFQKNMRKFDKPKDALANCIQHLESPNWEQNISGLQFFVRLIRHHPNIIDSQIHLLSVALAKQVRNLRSQVARSACQASAEFFSTHRRCIEGEAEDIATHLLHRTADTNKFLRADATHALESMCDNLSHSKVIHIISFKGATHQNAVVRTTAAKLLDKIVRQLGPEKVFTLPKESRDKLVLTGAQLLLEGSLETRNYTKSMFKQLSEHPNYNKVLLEVIPTRIYRNIEKALKSIRQM